MRNKTYLSLLAAPVLFAAQPSHATMIWSTYIGGSADDHIEAIAKHPSGDLLITGATFSSDFPTTAGAFDKDLALGVGIITSPTHTIPAEIFSQDIFVTRLSGDGKKIIFSTLIGGKRNEVAHDIIFDLVPNGQGDSGLVSGGAGGTGGGAGGSGSTTSGKGEAPSKNPAGGGGESGGTERIIIAGLTNSPDYPTIIGAVDTTYNHSLDANPLVAFDGFVTALDGTLGTLTYSTYLGGAQWDEAFALAVAPDHSVVVAGTTGSNDFPIVKNSLQTFFSGNYGHGDGFITRLSLDAAATSDKQLLYSSYVGGLVYDVAMINADAVIVGATYAGNTHTPTLPVKGAFSQAHANIASGAAEGFDGFVMRLTPSTLISKQNQLKFSSFLGGKGGDAALSIITSNDAARDLIIAGITTSYYNSYFPASATPPNHLITSGAFDTSYNGQGIPAAFLSGPTSFYLGITSGPFYGFDKKKNNHFTVDVRIPEFLVGENRLLGDIFLLKMKSDGADFNPILYGTYVGGAGGEMIVPGRGLALDDNGLITIAGYTGSPNFPVTPGSIDSLPFKLTDEVVNNSEYTKQFIPFVTTLDTSKQNQSALVYSTFLGDSHGYVADVEIVSGTNIVAAGRTEDSQFPTTPNPLKPHKTGTADGFVSVFNTQFAPHGKYGVSTDSIQSNGALFTNYPVELDFTDSLPTLGNPNFKLKISEAKAFSGKSVTLFISPMPLLPGQASSFGGTYVFVDLFSNPGAVLKFEGTINDNGNANIKIPLTPGATTVGKAGDVYAQAFIKVNNKYVATKALRITIH